MRASPQGACQAGHRLCTHTLHAAATRRCVICAGWTVYDMLLTAIFLREFGRPHRSSVARSGRNGRDGSICGNSHNFCRRTVRSPANARRSDSRPRRYFSSRSHGGANSSPERTAQHAPPRHIPLGRRCRVGRRRLRTAAEGRDHELLFWSSARSACRKHRSGEVVRSYLCLHR